MYFGCYLFLILLPSTHEFQNLKRNTLSLVFLVLVWGWKRRCVPIPSVNSTNNNTPFSTCCLYMFFPHSGPCSLVPNPYITGSMGYHNSSCQYQLGQLHNAHLHTLLLPRCTWSVIRTCMRAIERV